MTKTKVSIITVVLSILQTSPDQFRVFKSGSLLTIFESISPFCIHVLYMYWYCWYIGTSHSMSLYQYVTGTTLVLLFICTGTVGTVGTLVTATLCLCTNMLLVLLVHWYQSIYVSVPICYSYCWYIGTSHSMSLYQYVTGIVGTLVPVTLCLCTNMLLVLHWYCSIYVLVLWELLVHWYQPLYFSVPICYWYCTGTALYMYWYCGYCWYIGTSHSISLCLYVTGTTLVLLFICTGTVSTVGTLVPATLCLSTNISLVLHWYCSLYVLVLWVLLVHWYQPLYVSVPTCYWYCTGTAVYMYWHCGYCWYLGTSHSMSLCAHMLVVLLFICTSTVGTVGTLVPATLFLFTNILLVLHWYCSLYVLVLWALLVHWHQPLCVSVPICYWYCWDIGTSHFMSLYQYVTGTALVLLFICTGTVGTVGTLVPATLYLCTNMLLVLHWYCSLYVLVLWVLLVH